VSGIILDTNVVSEPKRPLPAARVQVWFEGQRSDDLYLTSTVIAELAQGIERLPAGRRRSELERWLDTLIADAFAGRILMFDVEAALIYGKLVANALAQGRTPKVADAQIAAVAWREGMAVATRDVADFRALQVPVIDPWANGS
jgi:predicted nucleic acid-binding protein